MDPIKFLGDVEAATSASVSTKGGSLTATLKKALRERLGEPAGGQLAAAALKFGSGQSLVLLGGGEHANVRVSRISANRFEIALDDQEDATVDDLTAAFLALKIEQFKRGETDLRGPIEAADWLAGIEETAEKAEAKHRRG